jgi:hypothetical protein
MTLSLNMSIAGIIAQGIFDYPMLPGDFNKYIVIPPLILYAYVDHHYIHYARFVTLYPHCRQLIVGKEH